MSNKEVFMRVQELGDLYLCDVLLSYIYPRVFICEDSYNCKYVFYEVSSRDNKDVWLVTKISKDEYYLLIDCQKAIQEVYKNKTGFNLFSITKIYGENEDSIELSLDTSKWIKKLPDMPIFAEKEVIDDAAEKTLSILTKKEKEYLSYVIRPFKNEIKHIYKTPCVFEGYEEITVVMTDCRYLAFPAFEKNTMYKGMEIGKRYTLKELNL